MAGIGSAPQEVDRIQRRKRNECRQKRVSSHASQPQTTGSNTTSTCAACDQRHRIGLLGGRDYLSLKLDDPSFNAPIFANLFDDEDSEGYTLIWSRPIKRNGD